MIPLSTRIRPDDLEDPHGRAHGQDRGGSEGAEQNARYLRRGLLGAPDGEYRLRPRIFGPSVPLPVALELLQNDRHIRPLLSCTFE